MNQEIQQSWTEPTLKNTVSSIFKSYPNLLETLLPAALGLALITEIGQYISIRDLAQVSYYRSPGAAYWGGLALTLLAGTYYFIVGILQTNDRMLGRESEQSYGAALSSFPSMLGTVLLYAIIIIFGLLMFVVPGLFLMILLLMGQVNVPLKKVDPFDALILSFKQVWGNFWFVAITLLVTVAPFMLAVSLANSYLQSLQMSNEVAAHAVAVLIGGSMTILAFPLGMSCMWHLYQALEQRRQPDDPEDAETQTEAH